MKNPLTKPQVEKLNLEMRELLKPLAGSPPRDLSVEERQRLNSIYQQLQANDAAQEDKERRHQAQEYRRLKDKKQLCLADQRRLEFLHKQLYGTGYKPRRATANRLPRWSTDGYGAISVEVRDDIL